MKNMRILKLSTAEVAHKDIKQDLAKAWLSTVVEKERIRNGKRICCS